MIINVRNICKSFGPQRVLDGIFFDLEQGQFLTLLGPSGCGKTTLLRILAGLEAADAGQIYFDGHDTTDWHLKERRVGFVFQHYALFRHMTVAENISFGLRMRPRSERPQAVTIRTKVDELLELIQLPHVRDRYPHQLSGGQRQRVALARALAIEPRVLLLDEPFGALDTKVRRELRGWLRDLQQKLGITCVMVTHDQEEAIELSDRIILMNNGRIEQQGSPSELFEKPASSFALRFLGTAQEFSAFELRHNATQESFVRPHDIKIHRDDSASAGLPARVNRISIRGASAWLDLETSPAGGVPQLVTAELHRDAFQGLGLKVGDRVRWQAERVYTFNKVASSDEFSTAPYHPGNASSRL
jgi:sulfate transport system ATP-binding protein